MKRDREIEILLRRLRPYDQLERRPEGLIRTIQRELKERYGARTRTFRNRAYARKVVASLVDAENPRPLMRGDFLSIITARRML
jgi:hypothetical protein